MGPVSSKVVFGIGVALAVAAISSIFVTMVAAQNQSGQQSSSSQSTGDQKAQQSSNQSQSSGGGNTITIPKGASSEQAKQFYQPDPAHVSAGSVTWKNQDSTPHTATADDGSFDTGNIAPGASGSANVQGQGKIPYHCTLHPFMKASLQVSSGGSSQQSSQASSQTGGNQSQQSNTQQPQGGQQNSSQQVQQNQSQGTQTAATSQGASVQTGVNQALQQAGDALIQAGDALQQVVGGTSTSSQQPTQNQQSANQSQPSGQQSAQVSGNQSQLGSTGQQQGSQRTQTAQSQQPATSGQSQQGGTNQIEIPQGAQSGQNGYYIPSNVQVASGSTVTWANKDSVAHTATAQDGSFDTGNIAPGASGSATVQGQGQIQYYCTIHPQMVASLTVGGSGGNAQAPANSGEGQQQGGSSGQQQQAGQTSEGFPIRTQASAFTVLPKSDDTDTGLEPEHKDDWVTANHDIYYTRSSQQTTIGKDNVDELQVKWILNSDFPIENPPLIIGDRGYAQDNAMRVLAFDVNTGLNLWKFDPGVADKQSQELPRGVFSHGITYDSGAIFAPTGANGTVVALNATDGELLWQSASIGDPAKGYRLPTPPIVWKDYVIVGSALGDEPPFAPAAKGSITAFNRTNGERIWNISTVTGAWVEGEHAEKNGGATVWSGGSFDPDAGVMYLPTGNAAPDFNATSRPPPNPYTSSIIAVDITTGSILWDTVSVSATDQHDWDTAWGTSLAKVMSDDGNTMKVVIAQNKRGEGFALDVKDGSVLWNKTIGVEFRTGAQPTPYGSGEVWPGANFGVEAYNANDNETAYFAASNMGFNYFQDAQGGSGHLKPVFDAIENGIGNGTVTAVDVATGKIKWEHPTEFPTWVSPAVTNGVVFSGHITPVGKPYKFSDFGGVTESPLLPSGIIMALDSGTGDKLWEFNVGAPIGIGGPSIGHGMLFVTTGSPAEVGSNKGGYIVAFGLPDDQAGTGVSEQVGGVNDTAEVARSNSGNQTVAEGGSSQVSPSGMASEAQPYNATKKQQPPTTGELERARAG